MTTRSATDTATAALRWSELDGQPSRSPSAHADHEDEPVITVDDNNLTGESWSADRRRISGPTTRTSPAQRMLASTLTASTPTASQHRQDQTRPGKPTPPKVDVTCYWPQIELTKTGDELSKIGDDVTYNIGWRTTRRPTQACASSPARSAIRRSASTRRSLWPLARATPRPRRFQSVHGIRSVRQHRLVTCKPVAATAPGGRAAAPSRSMTARNEH